MKTQFTAGPWGISERDYEIAIKTEQSIKLGFADRIAITHDKTGEDWANAKLIAAAPDLLEALQNLLNKDELNQFEAFEVEKKAIAAIKKATE